MRNDVLDGWDRAHMVHPLSSLRAHEQGISPTKILSGGEGVFIIDRDGRRFLDGFAGLFCVNVGYGRSEIYEAMAKQAKELAYYMAYLGYGTEASITLAQMVAQRTPEGLNHIFFGLGGSDANETNVKIAWYYHRLRGQPQKRKIISRWRAYHGATIMSGSLTGLAGFHKSFGLPLDMVRHTEAPYYYRRPDELADLSEEQFARHCADELEKLIVAEGPDTIAAFIGEPLLGTGGIVPPPKGYWTHIQKILKKYDILLIVDEVATGFGRLGKMFGSSVYDLDPDLLTIAKGITSAYAPLSGSVIHDRVWSVLAGENAGMEPFMHGMTYTAHPVSAAAGVANLKLLDELNLVENAASMGAYFRSALDREFGEHPLVGEIRGEGLLLAIELVKDRASRTFFGPEKGMAGSVVKAMQDKGVIARAMPQSDVVGFAPPLCISRSEVDTIVEATKRSLNEVCAQS